MKNPKYRLKLQAEMQTHWRKRVCGGGADTQPRRPPHTRYRERRVSPSPVKWLSYATVLVWRAAMRKSWISQLPRIHHARFVVAEQPRPVQSSPANYIWSIIQQSLPEKSAGCEWFQAASDWCVGWSGTQLYWWCHCVTSGAEPCNLKCAA